MTADETRAYRCVRPTLCRAPRCRPRPAAAADQYMYCAPLSVPLDTHFCASSSADNRRRSGATDCETIDEALCETSVVFLTNALLTSGVAASRLAGNYCIGFSSNRVFGCCRRQYAGCHRWVGWRCCRVVSRCEVQCRCLVERSSVIHIIDYLMQISQVASISILLSTSSAMSCT